MVEHDYATFTLQITGIDLDNIHAKDIGDLLAEFSRLLDNNRLKFHEIKKGSTIVSLHAPDDSYEQTLQNFAANINKPTYKNFKRIIRNYAATFEDIHVRFLASANADAQSEVICDIDYQEHIEYVTQRETLIGRLTRPSHGKDDTDHFTLLLPNDHKISVKVNKNLSQEIAQYLTELWLNESLLEFTGTAKYEIEGFATTLKEFTADDFEIISNNDDIEQWRDTFIGFGESGWQKLENPLEVWMKERH